jgi:prepilin-type N-terminal cleavage/methylation domain-containing protein
MKGFTLNELLIALAVFTINIAEVTQSGRLILKKISKELRQAREIVTDLPSTRGTATDTLEFEDGQKEEPYYYIHYFEEDGAVEREVKRYYFPSDPQQFLPWSATSSGEELAATTTEGPAAVGSYVFDLKFWEDGMVNIFIGLKKEGKEADFETKIFGRNL